MNHNSSTFRWPTVLILLLLIIITSGLYLPALHYPFSQWDDFKYVVDNPLIQTWNAENLKRIFTTTNIGYHHYHPLTLISYAWNKHLFGLDAFCFRAANLFLHLANIILVFLLAHRLTRARSISLICAALFAIHPLNAEPVMWIADRKDLLYGFFGLSSLLVYSIYIRDRCISAWMAAFVFFGLAVLSKPTAIILPLLFLVFDKFYGRQDYRRMIGEKLPFFIGSIVIGLIAIRQNTPGGVRIEDAFPLLDRLLFGLTTLGLTAAKTLVPFQLSPFHPFPNASGGRWPWEFYVVPVLVGLLVIAVFLFLRKQKWIVFGLSFYAVGMLLFIGIVPFGNFVMADRYAYVPGFGLFLIIAWGLTKILKQLPQYGSLKQLGVVLLLILFAGGLAMKTVAMTRIWKNDETLWSHVIRMYPEGAMPYYNLGNHYFDEGAYELAIISYSYAIEKDPTFFAAFNNRGNAYAMKGLLDLSPNEYTQAIRINPAYSEAYMNRAAIYMKLGKWPKAIKDLDAVLKMRPEDQKVLRWREIAVDNLQKSLK